MKNILFVCTGNIFRSLTAEYALRSLLKDGSRISISSAGTNRSPKMQVRDDVVAHLMKHGLDVSEHQRRVVTAEILEESDFVVSMNTDHRDILRNEFAIESTLFLQACGEARLHLPDVNDIFPAKERSSLAAQSHVFQTIDEIISLMPALAERLLGIPISD